MALVTASLAAGSLPHVTHDRMRLRLGLWRYRLFGARRVIESRTETFESISIVSGEVRIDRHPDGFVPIVPIKQAKCRPQWNTPSIARADGSAQ